MKILKKNFLHSIIILSIFILLCGILYTGAVTGIAQLLFPGQANGSMIKVNGVKYGSELLAQYYTDDAHMWGRIMNINTTTYKDADGNALLYSEPSNLSPAGSEFKKLVTERVKKLQEADPQMGDTPVPVDLVTSSGSGLDPDISPAAAEYQVARIASASGKSESAVKKIIAKCTSGRFLGIFGEKTVNVLKVNLMLDGILK